MIKIQITRITAIKILLVISSESTNSMLSCHAVLPKKLQLTGFCYKIQKHSIASSVQITIACCTVTLSDSLCVENPKYCNQTSSKSYVRSHSLLTGRLSINGDIVHSMYLKQKQIQGVFCIGNVSVDRVNQSMRICHNQLSDAPRLIWSEPMQLRVHCMYNHIDCFLPMFSEPRVCVKTSLLMHCNFLAAVNKYKRVHMFCIKCFLSMFSESRDYVIANHPLTTCHSDGTYLGHSFPLHLNTISLNLMSYHYLYRGSPSNITLQWSRRGGWDSFTQT